MIELNSASSMPTIRMLLAVCVKASASVMSGEA
jgi:hypothetical protein